MHFDDKRPEWDERGAAPTRGAPGLVARVAAIIGGAILLVSALALSIFFFAVVAVAGVLVGGYLWWKTRELRKQIRTQFASSDSQREIIEGEIIEADIIEGEVVGRNASESHSDSSAREQLLK